MEFREKLKSGKPLHGVMVTIESPGVCEALAECGFDWLWIDMEHAPLSLKEVQEMARAKGNRCAALVRIPSNSDEWIKRTLDLGVEGIIIPHVSTAQEAKQAVTTSLYPPLGDRSVGLSRVSSYGMHPTYREESNQNRLLFVQIEDKLGVQNVEEIARVPGLSGIIIGPYDLSGSYGKLGQLQDPEVMQAIDHVLKACKKLGTPVGIFAKDADAAKRYLHQGFQLVATGVDIHYLWTAAKATLDSLQTEASV
jgi:2-keto-3-deoxy-L-rhamnonate aldolase RhmA